MKLKMLRLLLLKMRRHQKLKLLKEKLKILLQNSLKVLILQKALQSLSARMELRMMRILKNQIQKTTVLRQILLKRKLIKDLSRRFLLPKQTGIRAVSPVS